MIAAILLGLAATLQAAPLPPLSGDDIVVIGERLKHLRIVRKRDRKTGIMLCRIAPSSGDAGLDAGICETYLACAPKVATAPALEACMRPALTELVQDWSRRRTARF